MACSEECSIKNFGLSHPSPKIFVNSQWKIPQALYMVYRVFIAVFFIVFIILSGVIEYDWYIEEKYRVKWFIYLTNWMFFTLTVETIVEMIVVGFSICKLKKDNDYSSMPWYFKMMWVLYNVSSTIGFVICIAYWALIFPYQGTCSSNEVLNECGSPATPTCSEPNSIAATVCVERCECPDDLPIWYDGSCITLADCPAANSSDYSTEAYELQHVYEPHYLDYVTHGAPLVYIPLNLFITGIPVRVHHFWHSIVYALVYLIFTVVYDAAGGTNGLGKPYIYSVLDWGSPGTAVLYAFIVGIIAPILFWLIIYGLYWIRIGMAMCCCGLTDKNRSLQDQNNHGSKEIMLEENGNNNGNRYTLN